MVIQRHADGGFTYIGVLILLVAFSVTIMQVASTWSAHDQRRRERELLRAGDEIRDAIGSYYESSPGTTRQYPPELSALLRDDRFINIRRYLRKIPLDAMSGKPDWELIASPSGGVMGVRISSLKSPFKVSNFSDQDRDLESAATYSDWQFVYVPVRAPAALPFTQ